MLPRLVGAARAVEMLVMGEPILAEKALDYGLVTQISEDPLAAAAEMVRKASRHGQQAQQAMRMAVWGGMERPLDQALELEAELIAGLAPDMSSVTETFTSKIRGGGS